VYGAIAQWDHFDSVVIGATREPAFKLKHRSQRSDTLWDICADLLLSELRFLLPGVAGEIGSILNADAVPGGELLPGDRRAA
jgi:hypothetical protein